MKWSLALTGLALGLTLLTGVLQGQQPRAFISPPTDAFPAPSAAPQEKDPGNPKQGDDKDKKDKEKPTPPTQVTAENVPPVGQGDTSNLAQRTLAPEMLGDPAPATSPIMRPTPILVLAGGNPVNTVPGGTAGGGIPVLVPGAANPGNVRNNVVVVPSARGFKVSNNGSARPQDRIYLTSNFYDDLNAAANRRVGADLNNATAYRQTFGFEKSFLDGRASVEMRLPLQTFNASSGDPDLNRTSTSFGDLSIAFRGVLYRDVANDNYFTAGLAVTPPTGPSTFGGIRNVVVLHDTTLQPFVAGLWHFGNLYAQGFTALDVPTDRRDVTLWYNDLGAGYFLYQNPDASRFLTAVAPTVEAHVSTPLNQRGGAFGVPDVVNLTAGVNLEFRRRAVLAIGVVSPVTGPLPFNVEGMVQFRLRF